MENTEVTAQEAVQTEERTFTQAELNAIVQKRLGEQAAKYGNYEELKEKALKFDEIEEQSKSELQKATERADALQTELNNMKRADAVRKIREEVSQATGVPAHLITGETKEQCEEQAKAIMTFAKPSSYPFVKDGGETGTHSDTGKTRDQFASWLSEKGGS